jgi:hypothetical protein
LAVVEQQNHRQGWEMTVALHPLLASTQLEVGVAVLYQITGVLVALAAEEVQPLAVRYSRPALVMQVVIPP